MLLPSAKLCVGPGADGRQTTRNKGDSQNSSAAAMLRANLCAVWASTGPIQGAGLVIKRISSHRVQTNLTRPVFHWQANYLRSVGVKKGDAVCIYMPMLPELPISMLACARIGEGPCSARKHNA